MSWTKFFHRCRWDEERARELSDYLEIETAENIARGMPPADAAAAAHRKLGNTTQVREQIYRMNSLGFLDTLGQDLRYGARKLRKSPGFTIVAVLTLALGVGANTALFSVVDWLLFQQLPVQKPKELVFLAFSVGGTQLHDARFSYPEYIRIREQVGNEFGGMTAFVFGGASGGQSGPDGMTVQGKTLPVQTFFVTGNFFSFLGLKPALGRFFTTEEGTTAGADPVVILSWEYWQSRFHGDPEIVGRQVTLNGHPVTIIGVAPMGFLGPTPALHAHAFLPLGMLVIDAGTAPDFLAKPDKRPLTILARLKPGSSAGQVNPALAVLGKSLLQDNPRPDEKVGVFRATRLRPPGIMSGENGNPLVKFAAMLLTLGTLVLLLACLNVANLLLVRATIRQNEMALRTALGAGKRRLVRQLLTESFLLAMLGCGGGIAIGLLAMRVLASIALPTSLPVFIDLHFDWLVFAFAFSIALIAGLVIGIIPALRAAHSNLNVVLQESERTSSGSRQKLRNVLAAAQIAGATALLIVAGLFTRSMQGVRHMDLGFDANHITNFTLDSNQIGYPQAKGERFYQELLDRVQALPGVESASMTAWIPIGDTEFGGSIDIPGFEPTKDQPHPSALYDAVSPGFFQTMGVQIARGRDVSRSDTADTEHVALINQAMANRYWPGKDPIGRQFAATDEPKKPIQIVGIVRNFHMEDPYSPIEPAYFVPLTQHYFATQTLQVRTTGTASGSLTSDISALVNTLAPAMPVYGVGSMSNALHGLNGLFGFQLIATLTAILGGIGLILAAVGVFGVMSYSVSQRTREIGIRVALGAQRAQILNLVGRQGLLVVTAGLTLGLLLAFAVGQLVQDFLVGVSPADPVTYAVISVLLAAVAMAACFVPARMAVRVDPIAALRNE